MKNNWDRWIHRDRQTLIIAGYGLCIGGLTLLYIRFTQPKPQNDSEFRLISGQLQSINFIDGSRGSRDYSFKLNDYINSFQIKADFLGFFYASKFKKLNQGDSLTVAISNTDTNKLDLTNDDILVYLIKNKNFTFLDSKDTIAFQNSNNDYFYFSGLFLVGLITIYFGYKSKIKKRIY